MARQEAEQQQQGPLELLERTQPTLEALQTQQEPQEEDLEARVGQHLEPLVEAAQHLLLTMVELVDPMFHMALLVDLVEGNLLLQMAELEAMEI